MTRNRIDWPAAFERTPPHERMRTTKFSLSIAQAFDRLESQLEILGADDWEYGFDAEQRKRDQRPYANARPDDPGFVLRWAMDGEWFAVACDRYTDLRDNVRAVGLYVQEKRKMEGRPVETGESEFSNARLPAGDEEAIEAAVPPHEVLGVPRDAPEDVIRDAFRERVKQTHPDQNEDGDIEEFHRVKKAYETLVDGEAPTV